GRDGRACMTADPAPTDGMWLDDRVVSTRDGREVDQAPTSTVHEVARHEVRLRERRVIVGPYHEIQAYLGSLGSIARMRIGAHAAKGDPRGGLGCVAGRWNCVEEDTVRQWERCTVSLRSPVEEIRLIPVDVVLGLSIDRRYLEDQST